MRSQCCDHLCLFPEHSHHSEPEPLSPERFLPSSSSPEALATTWHSGLCLRGVVFSVNGMGRDWPLLPGFSH